MATDNKLLGNFSSASSPGHKALIGYKINFIESYSVNELNKSYAKIKIRYLGKIKNLQDGFTKNGFEFQIIHNQWVLSIPS